MCRTLKAEEIECRVSQVSAKGCSLLLYKTARVDRAILDEEFGALNWQNDFKVIDGKMYGGIGISRSINGNTEWVWKWDCGTESNTEKEKGEASDCFKRAGFKWGIGIELYTAPFIFANVPTEFNKTKNKWELVNKYEKFEVKSISYKDGAISDLEIINSKGETVYKTGKVIKPKPTEEKKAEAQKDDFVGGMADSDIDLLAGISAIDDLENLKKYYLANYNKAIDKEAFNSAKDMRKKVLMKGE